MPSHYFIGIKGPADFESLINAYKEKYSLPETYKTIPHPDDLHVTLVFIGAIPESSLPLLTENLQAIAEKIPAFQMHIDGLSYFGSPAGPRVVYFSVDASEAIRTLQKEVDKTVATLLNRSISDRFTPHMTIAKKRKTTKPLYIQKEEWKPIEVPVHSFSLFTIHPEKSPKYEAVKTFTLS
ncbi:RNA 2',3'-cyclic phosphodiesterase [Sporosarcina sp. ACRSM]|uniref:RNA 2',3'-cyclic phosphodiesterase n=1 Tax=Sporosarcina sp. ACRSM TaxID=2918216 RepID=UPI001EF50ECC|nr:RNA 2',3'-cyclic phosphodiesterase [Sporosarcina sp. ACRSM]MCG7335727.1 RNA 2',3'-cyclic phosphodiesterase [Sporosarcina sp. ACRSM]